MDIIAKTVLEFIQKQKGFTNSVIAGGAVRDHALGLVPKDYDILVPTTKKAPELLESMKENIAKEFGVDLPATIYQDYGNLQRIEDVLHFQFEGKEFDIIVNSNPDDEDFGSEVVRQFDYGLNMAFFDGLYTDDTNEHYDRDMRRHTMTLVNIEHMEDLPRAMARFILFQAKALEAGFDFRFDSTILRLDNRKSYSTNTTVGQLAARQDDRVAWGPAPGDLVMNPNRPMAREHRHVPAVNEVDHFADNVAGQWNVGPVDNRPVNRPIPWVPDHHRMFNIDAGAQEAVDNGPEQGPVIDDNF